MVIRLLNFHTATSLTEGFDFIQFLYISFVFLLNCITVLLSWEVPKYHIIIRSITLIEKKKITNDDPIRFNGTLWETKKSVNIDTV